jgi:hypothetical protein
VHHQWRRIDDNFLHCSGVHWPVANFLLQCCHVNGNTQTSDSTALMITQLTNDDTYQINVTAHKLIASSEIVSIECTLPSVPVPTSGMLNIDFGLWYGQPSDLYGAAGNQAGRGSPWNVGVAPPVWSAHQYHGHSGCGA